MLLVGSFVYVLGITGVAADNFPAGQVATTILGETGGTVIRIVAVITGMSAIPPIIMMASRVPYAMSGDGLFSRRAGVVNNGGTPTVTLLLSALLSVGFILTGTFSQVIAVAAFFYVLQYVISFSALFAIRKREPNAPIGYKAIGFPVTTAISWLGGVAFLIGAVVQDRRNSAIAIGIIIASYPVYRLLGLPRKA
jgi:APA family basic amino acid/polyamine antiporter